MEALMNNRHLIKVLVIIIGLLVLIPESYADAAVEYSEGFSYSKLTKRIRKQITGNSYRKNKYIRLRDLRYVRVRYYNYKGHIKDGELIVNKAIANDVVEIFYELYEMQYPIHSIKLVEEYDSNDDKSMAADNTSCFNYRSISGSEKLSLHGLGLAIDINPRVNPCVGGIRGLVPANGKLYRQRDITKCKGKYSSIMIHKNDEVYKIFKKHGFLWGGEWKRMKDYQHFYKVPKKYTGSTTYQW